jgi:hypothetical protein
MPNPGLDLATALVAATPVGGVALVLAPASGCNVFAGPVQPPSDDVPDRAVFCVAYGGPAPEPYMDGTNQDWHESRVQVWVRSAHLDYVGGEAFARAVAAALQRRTVAGYVLVLALDEPSYMGQDEQGCHEWAVNFRMGHKS